MKSKFVYTVILAVILLFSNSCSYRGDGPTAPSGAYITTTYYTIYRNEWQPMPNNYGHYVIRVRNIYINSNVLNNAAILAYSKFNNNTWTPLPYSTTSWNQLGDIYTEEIWCSFGFDIVDIHYIYNNPLDPTPPNVLEIKVVIIQ